MATPGSSTFRALLVAAHGEQACNRGEIGKLSGMGLPSQPLTLSVEQIAELNTKLSAVRHDINNHLSMMMAAAELIRMKPEMAAKMADKLVSQPSKITELIMGFSAEFERTLGITRP